MNDRWMDRLSEYIDDELPVAERSELEAHLATCDACAASLDELRRVAARARSLGDRPPEADLWSAIAAHVSGVHPLPVAERAAPSRGWTRRLSITLPQLLAAGLVLAALSGAGTAWLMRSRATISQVVEGTRLDTALGDTVPSALAPPRVSTIALASPTYDAAIADLELVISEGRGRLRPETIRVLQGNLRIIDAAIDDARRALAADPASGYLHQYLNEQMVRKLELLRSTAAIVAARS